MFFRYSEIREGSLSAEKTARADQIAAGIESAEILEVTNRVVRLRLAGGEEPIEADVSLAGTTVYLGGFDWVTYQTPQHLLQHFPDLMPLPQQVFRPSEEEF